MYCYPQCNPSKYHYNLNNMNSPPSPVPIIHLIDHDNGNPPHLHQATIFQIYILHLEIFSWEGDFGTLFGSIFLGTILEAAAARPHPNRQTEVRSRHQFYQEDCGVWHKGVLHQLYGVHVHVHVRGGPRRGLRGSCLLSPPKNASTPPRTGPGSLNEN